MLIPRTGSEITAEWLKMVIETHERLTQPEFSFTVKDFNAEAGTKPGESFNSDLVKVEIKGSSRNENSGVVQDKTYNLMLKFHSLYVATKELNKLFLNHIREMNLYAEIHKTLSSFQEEECQGKYKLNIPELFYTYNEGDVYVLVMQNLKPLGYILNDKRKGLSFEHLKLAVTQLARWHALSYVYNKKFNLIKEYPYLVTHCVGQEFVLKVTESILKNIYPLVPKGEEYSDFYKRIQNKSKIREILKSKIMFSDSNNTRSFNCLCHGDFWNNNLLYSYNSIANSEDEIPTDISIVDWQMIRWNSPIIDLQYLLHTSTSYAIRKEHMDTLLLHYYTIFDEILHVTDSPIPNWNFKSFKKEFDDATIVGFTFGCVLSQGTLSKAGERMNGSNNSIVDVHSFSYSLKSKIAKALMPFLESKSMGFLMQAMLKKMFEPIRKEIREGTNEVMNDRLRSLIDEAIEKGTLDCVPPV